MVKTTIRTPMSVKMRAKQFMMFDALKGLTEAIAEKEKQYAQSRALMESRIEEINRELMNLKNGNTVSVQYCCQNGSQLQTIMGKVNLIDPISQTLKVVETTIHFHSVYEIRIIEL